MALSEQERRMLQEIEQALIAEDPSLAKQASGSGGGQGGGGVTVGIRSVAVLLLGLCVLIAGIALSQNSLWFVAMAAVGFFIMFGGGLLAFRSGSSTSSSSRKNSTESGRKDGGDGGVADRMEDSFRKRFE
ncbi:MAG: DUF3040 domain-containing protein [Corynebacterium sp.]|uniref:DUF3040 domain-containing protein n=1 Tax=Corynebacterium TaxID=1716 RepID=UPI0026492D2F|nr:DUF3040 domain-containing protein [Corynebacterium sp.]MDN5724014.1 DUF3040 domain-containing protein [Corynebacterium sp.]MDN6283979.1 DUF3040 domain-containing protein [Corynebacterium sp.]MDN6304579.1 DUF3040 domain-containing protein [Corynebacterium sp.]MDN6368873.1 DUF3040 domain-containing protein [Corynebacterium sp.]MDN6375653.1 DUF3040 domain-containing protein [Corynebacterium sp.]